MRFLLQALASLLFGTGLLGASDLPTLKTALPDLPVSQGAPVSAIDLRSYFEITSITGQVVQMRTNLGSFNLELRADAAPLSVANFVNSYVNTGRYTNTLVHRSDQGLGVIQGGGYLSPPSQPSATRIVNDAPIALEYNLPNARGTIAMARTAALNSATSEWFINTDDNSVDLGAANNGGYAVFGRVTGTGMTVVDAIAALPAYNAAAVYGPACGQLPLTGYSGVGLPVASNFVTVSAAEAIPLFPASVGQRAVVSFSVSNSNPSLASAAVSGSSLSITPLSGQSGFADITVTATDTNGNSVQDTFRLTIAPGVPEIAVEKAGANIADGESAGFPVTHLGSSADLVFTVKNLGNGNLALTGSPRVTIDGADAAMFTVVAQPAPVVSPSGSTSFLVRFTPGTAGAKTAALHLANDDADENAFDINLIATANTLPALHLPSPAAVEATSPNGAVVTFAVTADDAEDGTLAPVVSPQSGSVFPVGNTTVNVSATDSAGGTRAQSFTVTVADTAPPQIGGTFSPLALSSDRTGKAALPDYTAQAVTSDLVGVTALTQSPPAGALVADGTVPVTLTAHDGAGNTAQTSFDVAVIAGTSALVAKGEPVPGAGVDSRIPAGAKWSTFGVPAATMNGATEVGWLSTVTAGTSSFSGVFSGPIGAPALRLRTSEPATDAAGAPLNGVTFASFRTPVFAGPDFAVLATVKGTRVVSLVNDTGLWVNSGGALRGIARAGTAAPGAGSAKFLAITSFAMPAPGTLFFTAKLSGATTATDFGLWRWTSASGTQLVVREGAMLDVGSGPLKLLSFRTLGSVTGSPGHARYDAAVPAIDMLLTFTNGSTAIATALGDGTLQATARSGAADGAGRVAKTLSIPSSPGAGLGATAVTNFLPNPALNLTTANSRAVFDFETQTLLAQSAVTAPGASPAKFSAFQSPVAGFGAGGQRATAFVATLTGTTMNRDLGVWSHTPAGGLAMLAREGAVPPGATGTKWLSFPSVSVLDGRGPMFVGKLMQAAPTVTTANDTGFWATDSTGALRLLLRTGDRIGTKKLQAFTLLGAVSGSPGQRRAWTPGDVQPRVFYRASFADGTSAILNTVVP